MQRAQDQRSSGGVEILDNWPLEAVERERNMDDMKASSITLMSDHRNRGRRIHRAVEARRELRAARSGRKSRRRAGGRAWINGFELGGTDSRHTPLAVQFD
jgi:hypothetical protein